MPDHLNRSSRKRNDASISQEMNPQNKKYKAILKKANDFWPTANFVSKAESVCLSVLKVFYTKESQLQNK